MDRDSHSEDTLSTMVLENIKNKLIHAFRATGGSREDPQESGSTVRPVSLGRSFQANEELRRAQIDGAITWLRSELVSSPTDLTFRVFFFCSLRHVSLLMQQCTLVPLRLPTCSSVLFIVVMQLEMRSQDLQLAQTLLGLNTEIQRLRRESFGGVEIEGDDQQ